MIKRIISLVVAFMLIAMLTVGCGNVNSNSTEEQSNITTEAVEGSGNVVTDDTVKYDKNIKISATALQIDEGYDYQNDQMVTYFQDKFNVTLELIPISWSNWTDKNRVWISSGDMPDITFWDFNYTDYNNYAEQGLIRELPEGIDEKYPNLAAEMKKTQISDFVKANMDGKLYMVPKVVFFDKPADIITSHISIYYRKDWADKVGIEVGNTISLAELAQLSKAFSEQDPGGNGAGKTVGFASTPTNVLNTYLSVYSPSYANFYKKDGSYVWGPADPKTLEGLKALKTAIDDEVIYRDFFTAKAPADYLQLFYAGKTGIINHMAAYGMVYQVAKDFGKANPDLNPEEAVGVCVPVDDAGMWHGQEATNYWAASLFNPSIDDEKMDRILALMDYVSTQEGQDIINIGFEGKDYTKENDQITITRDLDSEGNFIPMSDSYKSFFFWAWFTVLWDNYDVNNPSIPDYVKETVSDLYQVRAASTDISMVDFDLLTFSAPNIDKSRSIKIDEELTQVVLKDGDLEQNWNEWVKSKEPIINPSLDELNEAFAK